MRTLVMGDCHGAARAVKQVLGRASFDPENDRLIFLGDIVDGWSETPGCFEIFLEIRNKIMLLGNHDEWFGDWVYGKPAAPMWIQKGGRATYEAYGKDRKNVPPSHAELLSGMQIWHEETRPDGRRCLFVHGGCGYPYQSPMGVLDDVLLWDRDMYMMANACHLNPDKFFLDEDNSKRPVKEVFDEFMESIPYDEVYVGHTSTWSVSQVPYNPCGGKIWNLDQGGGWHGKLSVMDIDTKEYWQSDVVSTLYPGELGRR